MSDRVEQTDSRQIDEAEKIDLIKAVEDFLHGLKKLWLLILALIVLGAGVSYFRTTYTYTPQYVASATMAVTGPGGEYSGTATQMAEIFPYILSSGVLQDVVAREMGMDYVPGSVSAQAEEGTNLLTMSVTSNDAQMAYDVLHKMIECYPEVAEILDETGVPSDTRREIVVRGSYRRGAVQGALAGLVILCLYVFLKKTVRSKEKLKKYINLPDMGSLPYIKQKKRNKKNRQTSVSLLNERIPGAYREAMQRLEIRVSRELEEKQCRTIMVTSSIPGEGKTTVSANLAISLAKHGKRVILVDCDLRNPSVAVFFGMPQRDPGLGAVLAGKARVKDVLKERKVENGQLLLLPGESQSGANVSLLGSEKMKTVIQELSSMADVVLLDTAPAQLLADAAMMARYVDSAVYVIRYDYTKMGKIREGIQSLSLSKIKMLGYVFNCDRSAGGSRYGYGYGRYGSYSRYGHYGHYGRPSGRVIKE